MLEEYYCPSSNGLLLDFGGYKPLPGLKLKWTFSFVKEGVKVCQDSLWHLFDKYARGELVFGQCPFRACVNFIGASLPRKYETEAQTEQ